MKPSSPEMPSIDPDGTRLPIKLDTTSNGEFQPVPLSPANNAANRLAHEAADANAKRLAVSRRDFLVSACGAASTLLAFNTANAAVGKIGGFFDLPAEAALEPSLAQAAIGSGKGEFIFDVQGHFVDPNGAWIQKLPQGSNPLSQMPKTGCGLAPSRRRTASSSRTSESPAGRRRVHSCRNASSGFSSAARSAG